MNVEDNAAKKESLSALMDGETDELELRRILRDIPQNDAMSQTWRRYNVVRDVLHGEICSEEARTLGQQTHSRIMAAIAEEPLPTASGRGATAVSQRGWAQWKEGLGKAGIAASVAVVFFLGMESISLHDEAAPGTMLSEGSGQQGQGSYDQGNYEEPDGDASQLLAVEAPNEESIAEAQQRLNSYIQEVSIQYRNNSEAENDFNLLEDSPLIRSVNQIQQ